MGWKPCYHVALISLFFLFMGCAMQTKTTKQGSDLLQKKFLKTTIVKTVEMNYLLYLPQDFEKESKKWPLMIFLHGAGERGNDLELVKRHGPPKLVEQGRQFPFILVAPQCPLDRWWNVEELDAWLDVLLNELPVDRSRIYLTGLSMGGFGTWFWAILRPDRFAAIAPICGWGNPLEAAKLKDIPVWVFHGARDPVIPLQRSQEMVEALKKAGAEVKFTIYPEAGHDSWSQTYDNPELYHWFLKHQKK
ncbi:carboxylesterase family protein [Caldithrix abyssi]